MKSRPVEFLEPVEHDLRYARDFYVQDVDTVTLQPGSAFLISSAAALAGLPLRVSVLRFLNFLSTGTTDERPGARMPSSACRSTDTRSRGANTAQTIGQPVAHRPHFP